MSTRVIKTKGTESPAILKQTEGDSSDYVLELRLEGLPKPTNRSNVHWRVRAKHAKEWKQKAFTASWHLGPPSPLTKAKLTLVRCSSVPIDFDGLVSSFKHVIDGLVQAKILIDDNMSVIGQPTYEWIKGSPKLGYITIKVESVNGTN